MAYARRNPYLHATWIPRYLTGDKSCSMGLLVQGELPGLRQDAQ